MWLYLIVLLAFNFSPAQTLDVEPQSKLINKILTQNKFNKKFISDVLKVYELDTFSSVARLNILGFLNPPNHQNLVTEEAAIKTEEYLVTHQRYFSHIEKKYTVPAPIIASLLWIETRHGQLTGKYHVISVYLHMLQLTRKDVVKALTDMALNHENADKKLRKKIPKLIKDRTKRKSAWALDQLRALAKIYYRDQKLVLDLKGSFAGAFGISQFIPSSYNTYARPYFSGKVPDLYKPEDAIASVAFYLKKEGFKKKSRKAQLKALMHYNNSEDYALSILNLSQRLMLQKK